MIKEIDLEKLILIAGGHSAFQLLWAGVQQGVFDQLSENPGMDRAELCEKIGLQDYPAQILLTGLTALGLIRKDGDMYFNAPLTEQMLVSGKEGSGAPILGWQAQIVYPGLKHFVESLRQSTNVGLEEFPGQGNTLYERLTSHPGLEQVFQDAMCALSLQANDHLRHAYDFSRFSHIADIGGGDGTNAIALAKHYPDLRVTVFDYPSVCEIARQKVAEAGLGDRVSVCPGDLMRDPFPPDIDSVIYCHVLPIWSQENMLKLLGKTHASLPKGGSALIFNMMGNDDETGPLSTALGNLYFLAIASGQGMLHPWKVYEASLRQAGFSTIERISGLPLDHGLIVAEK